MPNKSDAQLLREYAAHGDEPAFGEIVARHTDLVYSAALRQCGAPEAAREVAQSVFIDLARKARALAGTLSADASLAGWLFRGTRFAGLKLLRDDQRRQTRERQFMEHFNPATDAAPGWEHIAPVLDEAMAELDDADHEAVLLRYFQNQDFHAVGRALGISDDAAQKRVSRAVERLREFLAKRGVTVGASGLVVIISTNAVLMAPAGLSAAITAAAVAGATIATTAIATATKTITMTALQKTFIAATLAAAIGAGIYEASQVSTLRTQVQILQRQTPVADHSQQQTRERDDAMQQLAALREENDRLNRNTTELLRLRGEVGVLRAQTNDSARLQEENRQYRANLEEVAKSMASPKKALFNIQRACTINSAKDLSVAIRRYAKDNDNLYPTNFSQFMSYITNAMDMVPSTIGLNTFELIPGVTAPRPVEKTPDRILFREKTARQSPDGKWERIYGFTDGSAWPATSDDGNFENWEKQRTVLP